MTPRRTSPRWPEERAFPRVQYPSGRRPYLVVGGEVCEVVDCSERGLRYGSALDPSPVGSRVTARLCFRGGAEVEVRGRVVRVQDGEVALSLTRGIPAERIAEEAARLSGEDGRR